MADKIKKGETQSDKGQNEPDDLNNLPDGKKAQIQLKILNQILNENPDNSNAKQRRKR